MSEQRISPNDIACALRRLGISRYSIACRLRTELARNTSMTLEELITFCEFVEKELSWMDPLMESASECCSKTDNLATAVKPSSVESPVDPFTGPSTRGVEVDSFRTVPSSRITGYASLRYAPRPPEMSEQSTT